jgi:hypothetical protein
MRSWITFLIVLSFCVPMSLAAQATSTTAPFETKGAARRADEMVA